jgi:hypothetical protein
LAKPVIPEVSPGVRFLVVDQCAVEASGLVTPVACPIIIPLVGVETLRLDVGRPVEVWCRRGLNLDRGEAFLCERCRLNRDPGIELGQFSVQLGFHVFF